MTSPKPISPTEPSPLSALHHQTPCVFAAGLSRQLGREILLKLENLQPSGSFKLRGIGALCQSLLGEGCRELVSSSGGNAGYSAAWAASELGVPICVFLPESTPMIIQAALSDTGASLTLAGAVWDEAHAAAMTYAATSPGSALVHPFDDPRIWAGHATMLHEAVTQMPRPDLIILSVGGGGLLAGVIEGMNSPQVNWTEVPVLAVETEGAASFAAALAAGGPVTLDRIATVARTLGARRVCKRAWEWAQAHPVSSLLVTDDDALTACRAFARDQRMLVEPACGAALAALYAHGHTLPAGAQRILVIVCGGIDVYPGLAPASP